MNTIEELGDQYCMIGPFIEDRVKLEVDFFPSPTSNLFVDRSKY